MCPQNWLFKEGLMKSSKILIAATGAVLFLLTSLQPASRENVIKTPEIQGAQNATTAQKAQTISPKILTPEQALNRKSIFDLQLSPDGNRIAMVVSEPIKGSEQRRNIWVYDIAARKLMQFTTSAKSDSRPRWSPDAKALAFLSNRSGTMQIYLLPLDGGEAQALTESKTSVSSFEWSPVGRKIAYVVTPPKTEEEEKKEKEKDDARVVDRDEKNPQLVIMDIESKATKTLIQGKWRFSEYVWVPNGKQLVVMATDHPQRELFTDKIYTVDAEDGKMNFIAAPRGPFDNIKVSPDGKTLGYVSSRLDGPTSHDLYLQPITGGEAQNLTAQSIDRPIGHYTWKEDANIFFIASTGFTDTFYTVTPEEKAEKFAASLPVSIIGSYVKGEKILAFVGETATQAPELWLSAPAEGKAEKVTAFNKEWESIKLAQLEIFRYPSFDKKEIEAGLLKPADAQPGATLPLVVLIHGGPSGAWTDRFNSWGQLLAARGFAVFYPNIRGSTGYGHEFMVANRKDWGGGDLKDIMAGVDYLIKKGIADPERLAIGGWSYGGYMAAWAVTQTQRFKASISGAPMTDLALEYGAEEASINAYDTWFLGTPYENLSHFIERSPLTYVKKVKTPILILCGENDTTDPIEQCYQFHRGLKRYGVETEFVAYPREGHGIREEKHQLDMLNRIIAWFEKYLKKT